MLPEHVHGIGNSENVGTGSSVHRTFHQEGGGVKQVPWFVLSAGNAQQCHAAAVQAAVPSSCRWRFALAGADDPCHSWWVSQAGTAKKDVCVLSLDLGGTHAALALVSATGILQRCELPIGSATRLSPLLPQIAQWARGLQGSHDLAGFGIGFPGIVDTTKQRVTSTNGKYDEAVNLDLSAWCETELGLPLFLENDARMALLGESVAGAARGQRDVVMLTLGTGIGCAVLAGGSLYRGAHGQGGILGGHITVRVGGRLCTCGSRGCAESEASGWALPELATAWPGFAQSPLSQAALNFRSLFGHAAAGDETSRQVRDHCIEVWAATAVSAIHQFDPELLLLGGGIMQSADVILPVVRARVERAWTPWGRAAVAAAQLGPDAALFGPLAFFIKELS